MDIFLKDNDEMEVLEYDDFPVDESDSEYLSDDRDGEDDDRCDLDPEKICDNCMKCIQGDAEFRGIVIDGIRLEDESAAGNLPENLP